MLRGIAPVRTYSKAPDRATRATRWCQEAEVAVAADVLNRMLEFGRPAEGAAEAAPIMPPPAGGDWLLRYGEWWSAEK
jgi:hypothetical protein